MYELSTNLENRIKNLVEHEPETDDFTVYTVKLNGVEMNMLGAEVHENRKHNDDIVKKEMYAFKESMGEDPENKMDMYDFQEWYKETVVPKLDDFEILEHDFDTDAFNSAAGAYHNETKAVRAQFKDEIIEHYGLRDSEDADLWIMESGGEYIPTADVINVIKAFDSLVNDIDSTEETGNQEGILEA